MTLAIKKLSAQTVAIYVSLLIVLLSESLNLAAANSNNQQDAYFQRPQDPNSRPQLMVAIYCGDLNGGKSPLTTLYHSQYLEIESRKWRTDRDPSAFCTRDKQAILSYCKKVYPNHDIRNIVESSRPYKIDNWCKLGSSKRRCRTRLTVRPYRCLEGTFQSDALLVPEKCVFDHVHNKSVCEGPGHWNQTASTNCKSKGSMKLQSFAMLQPCGLDVFAGVEFVCCPQSDRDAPKPVNNNLDASNSFAQAANGMLGWSKDSKYDEKFNSIKLDGDEVPKRHQQQNDHESDRENEEHGDSESDDEDEDDYDEDEYDDDSSSWQGDKGSSSTSTTTTTTTTTTTERPIEHYLSHFDLAHERDDFRKAEIAVETNYKDKITHVLREWSQLDGRYEEIKKKDPQAAEEFKKKMSHQFQKTIEALEEEGTAQRHQLASMHAERAMAIINRRKKSAMDCLTQALDKMPIRTRQVERCIVKLLKALEKDRTHTLRQYKNLLNLNTREALNEKKIILDHLVTLNRAANQSIAMLDRSPVLVEKLKNKIIAFWHQLRNVPLNEPIVRESEQKIIEKFEEEVAQQKIEEERKRLVEQGVKQQPEPKEVPKEQPVEDSSTDRKPQEINYTSVAPVTDKPANEPAQTEPGTLAPVPQHQPLQMVNDNSNQANNLQISEQHEHSSAQTHYQIDQAGFSHLKADSPYHELSYSVKHEPIGSRLKLNFSTFLVASCATVVVLAFLGVKYFGRNSSRAYRRQGFAEVSRSCTEEKNVTHMQFNGYENPAYKFFEAEA